MKKLITILAITSLFSFQAFAQLASDACDIDLPTCQAFEVPVDGEVLQDFTMEEIGVLSLGKVRRGEQIDVVEGNTHRGKATGFVTLHGALNTAYKISCVASSSIIEYSDGATQALDTCTLQNDTADGSFAALIENEEISSEAGNTYEVAASILVDENAADGAATGVVHLEVAYE